MKIQDQIIALHTLAKGKPIAYGLYGGIEQFYVVGVDAFYAQLGDGRDLPDYLNDLNLIQKIEESLDSDYREPGNYWDILGEVTGAVDAECFPKSMERVCMASAKTRAKAILKFKGLWTA
jgi:hypothetical protein